VRVRVVLGVAVAFVAVAVGIALSQRAPRMSGTNFVVLTGPVVSLSGGSQSCQAHTYVAPGTAAVQLVVVESASGGVPPLSLRLRDGAGVLLARGRIAGAPHVGTVTVPLRPAVRAERRDASVCLRNESRTTTVVLKGNVGPREHLALVDGRPAVGVVSLRYLRPGRESWWALLPQIARRFGLGKAPFVGSWTLPLLALLLGALWIAVVRMLLRADA